MNDLNESANVRTLLRKAQEGEGLAREIAVPYTRSPIDWEAAEEHGPPAPRDWILDGWIGCGHITLLSGLGGLGKSILAQQLTTCIATGVNFVSTVKQSRVSLYWAGEDDERELTERQFAVCKRLHISIGSLRGRLMIEPLDRIDCSLVELASGNLIRTSMLKQLREQVGDYKAEFVVLDNIARLFGGNENDRHHVSMFMSALSWAVAPTAAGVLLIGHVAKLGGSEFSGSTAWENAARARLLFTDHPPDKKDDEKDEKDEQQADLRYLCKRKANYSSKDLTIMRYEEGSYVMVKEPAGAFGLVQHIDRGNCRQIVLKALTELITKNFDCSDARTSHQYLPRLIIDHKMAETYSKRDLADAMHTLVIDGDIVRNIVKTANRSTTKVVLTPKTEHQAKSVPS